MLARGRVLPYFAAIEPIYDDGRRRLRVMPATAVTISNSIHDKEISSGRGAIPNEGWGSWLAKMPKCQNVMSSTQKIVIQNRGYGSWSDKMPKDIVQVGPLQRGKIGSRGQRRGLADRRHHIDRRILRGDSRRLLAINISAANRSPLPTRGIARWLQR